MARAVGSHVSAIARRGFLAWYGSVGQTKRWNRPPALGRPALLTSNKKCYAHFPAILWEDFLCSVHQTVGRKAMPVQPASQNCRDVEAGVAV